MTLHGWIVDHLDIALVLSVIGLVVHWIRRVNGIFIEFEHLRHLNEKELAALKAALHEHVLVSEQVWADVGRRLNLVERGLDS